MVTFGKGSVGFNLGIVKLSGELTELDRQCAWELYAELSTRVALTGRCDDTECKSFDGELYVESLDSVFMFFREAREIMKKFPVGKLGISNDYHLGVMINGMLNEVLRPFLEKWHVKFRHWWEHGSNPRLTPMERQQEYQELTQFLADWTGVRKVMRGIEEALVREYQLVNVRPHSEEAST